MNKRIKLYIFIVLFSFLIMYFGYEGIQNNINDSSDFIGIYLDNFQRYFYIITLFICIVISNLEISFYNPEIAIRIDNLPFFLVSYYLPIILISSVLILAIFLIVCITFGYSEPLNIINVELLARIFSTITSYFIAYITFYCITKKVGKSLIFLIILNFLFLIIGLSIQYYINQNISTVTFINYYNIIISILGIVLLFKKIKRMEILSNDIY